VEANLQEASIIVLVLVLVADKAMGYFKTRGVDLVKIGRTFEDVDFRAWYNRDAQLYAWHDHDDPEQPGVKIWWNQKYIIEIIRSLGECQQTQTDLIRGILDGNKTMVMILESMEKQIEKQTATLISAKSATRSSPEK